MSYQKKQRKVSVIMGIYNCASTLSDAIESLLAQTFSDWELIMCDDCSLDNTASLAHTYEDRYDNILLISNDQNMGLAATLNHCLKYADSEYIARMDGDDISMPDRFEKEVAYLDNHPEYALVSCEMIHFDETGEWGISRYVEKPEKKDFLIKSPFCHAGSMMRRKHLNEVGNYTVSELLRRGQDYWLWHKFYCAGYKGYNLQEPLYKMRDGQDAAKRRTFKSAMTEMKAEYKIFKNLGIPWYYRLRALRSPIVTLIPKPIYMYLHKRKQRS